MSARGDTGRRAEGLVVERLRGEGYEIVAQNARVGRLELDIVARRGRLLVVCEVRSRTSSTIHPAETIDPRKIDRIRRATAQLIRETRPGTNGVRFDVAAVMFDADGTVRIDYYEDAF